MVSQIFLPDVPSCVYDFSVFFCVCSWLSRRCSWEKKKIQALVKKFTCCLLKRSSVLQKKRPSHASKSPGSPKLVSCLGVECSVADPTVVSQSTAHGNVYKNCTRLSKHTSWQLNSRLSQVCLACSWMFVSFSQFFPVNVLEIVLDISPQIGRRRDCSATRVYIETYVKRTKPTVCTYKPVVNR